MLRKWTTSYYQLVLVIPMASCHCLVTWSYNTAKILCHSWVVIPETKHQYYTILFDVHDLLNSIMLTNKKPLFSVLHYWLLYRGHQSIQTTKAKYICGHPALSCGGGGGFKRSRIHAAKKNPKIFTMYASLFLSAQQFWLTVAEIKKAGCKTHFSHYANDQTERSCSSRLILDPFLHVHSSDLWFGWSICKLILSILEDQIYTEVRGFGPYMRFGLWKGSFHSSGHSRSSCSTACFLEAPPTHIKAEFVFTESWILWSLTVTIKCFLGSFYNAEVKPQALNLATSSI